MKLDYSATELLAIKDPESLFTGEPFILEKEHRQILAVWHPDRCSDPQASIVTQHISELYIEAVKKLKDGIWNRANYINLLDIVSTKTYEIHYLRKREFELGTCYISKSLVTYVIDKDYEDLYNNAIAKINSFKFASTDMEKQMRKFLPTIKVSFQTPKHLILVIDKNPDLISLGDAFEYLKQDLDSRHTAWIMSSLYNLECYLHYTRLTHNNVSLDTYFISPEFHGGVLIGGWWYAANLDAKMLAVPAAVANSIPVGVLNSKRANSKLDLELIRALGRQLISGYPDRINLVREHATCPEALKSWLTGISNDRPVDDYKEWQDVLTQSFGPRKFTTLDLTFNQVYGD